MTSRTPGETSRGLLVFLLAFVASFLCMAGWSFASPLFSGPDEPVHVIKAAAVVRGELLGDLLDGPSSPFAEVHVPQFYATTRNIPSCYHGNPYISAACAPAPSGGGAPTIVWIYNARYPPLYYAIIGLPSLLGDSDAELYMMRLSSALLCSVFVGLAAMTAVLWSCSRTLLLGVVAAATPMAVYLGGVVNPSGLEIAAAVATWTAGLVLVLERLEDPPPGLLVTLGVSACTFELVRGLSPFWLFLTVLALAAMGDPRGLVRSLRRRRVQYLLAPVALFGVAALVWIVKEHSLLAYSRTPVPRSVPESTILETSFAHTDYYLKGMIGVFGWFDTYAPTYTYVVWAAATGFLALAGVMLGRLRQITAFALLAVAVVVVPVALSASQAHRFGYTWSGRDTLPLAVGLPLMGAALLGRSGFDVVATPLGWRIRHRLAVALVTLLATAQLAAFFEALRRYAVGTAGADLGFLTNPAWRPPGGFAALLVAEAVGLGGASLLVTVALGPERSQTKAARPVRLPAVAGPADLTEVGPFGRRVKS